MATVHLARDVKHGRTVAIKVLRPDLAQAVGSERFLREINIAAQLQSPHILPMLESGEADGLLYYVMPYVQGDSLRDRLVKQGALPASEAMRLLRDVVDALAHAHRHQVVHRDIKPDNVMIAERHAVVMDFGVAKAMSDAKGASGITSIGISLGTPAYMAPEQAAADPHIDHRADIYSVGVLAYEMLAGKPPFEGSPQSVLTAQIRHCAEAAGTAQAGCVAGDRADRDEVPGEGPGEPVPDGRGVAAGDRVAGHSGWWRRAVGGDTRKAAADTGRARRCRAGVRRRGVHCDGTHAARPVGAPDRTARTATPGHRRRERQRVRAGAQRIEEAAPGDSALVALWPGFSRKVVIHTEPEGATIARASMADTSRWYVVGITPTDSVRLPIRVGMFRVEKPGFRTVYSLMNIPVALPLDSVNAPHPEMARIPGGNTRAFLVGSDGATPLQLGEYRIDRFEVSNSQYKAFVDAGGYTDRQWWDQPFVDTDGRALTFEAAMSRFRDRTGRPGPATWEAGTFPAGQGDMPVGGVSWYEAAAFAKFAGKSLPDHLPLGTRRECPVRAVRRAVEQPRMAAVRCQPARLAESASLAFPTGRQCARVVHQRRRSRPALHTRRRMERSVVLVRRRLRSTADGSCCDQRHSPREVRRVGHRVSRWRPNRSRAHSPITRKSGRCRTWLSRRSCRSSITIPSRSTRKSRPVTPRLRIGWRRKSASPRPTAANG